LEQYLSLWNKALLFLKDEIDPAFYNEVFIDGNINKIAKVENNLVYMLVPNALSKFRIEKSCANTINSFVKEISDPPVRFKFLTEEELNSMPTKANIDVETTRPQNNMRVLSPLYTFNSFEVGESNRFAFLAAMKVAENSEKVYNPLYIFGGVGLGKTHLMSAIGNYILDYNFNANVVYTSAQKFAEDYFLATNNKHGKEKIADFYKKYNSADILLVDDIQFLENKQATQEEFFKIFDNLVTNNKQIVVTSDKPANELNNVMSRLKSRFNWGLTVNIKQPDLNLRVNVLKNKLITMIPNPNSVPNEVLTLLANYFQDNIRDLEGALRTYINYCSFMGVPYNESSFYTALDSVLPKEVLAEDSGLNNISKIKEIVSKYFNVTINEIDSKSRKAQIVYARQIIMYILKNNYNLSLKVIGSNIGDRDHTTVLHGIDKITIDLQKDPMIKSDIDIILSKIKD